MPFGLTLDDEKGSKIMDAKGKLTALEVKICIPVIYNALYVCYNECIV